MAIDIEHAFDHAGLDPIPRKWIIEAIEGYGAEANRRKEVETAWEAKLDRLAQQIEVNLGLPLVEDDSPIEERKAEIARVLGFLHEWEEVLVVWMDMPMSTRMKHTTLVARGTEVYTDLKEHVELLRKQIAPDERYEQEFRRLARIEAKRAKDVVMSGTTCSRPDCNRP